MVTDLNKSLTVEEYNHLNLPQQIDIANGNANSINYLYNAAGVKLRKQNKVDQAIDKTTDYVGNIIYEDSKIAYILTNEGRLLPNGSTYEYQYYLKDHLGNTRILFDENKQVLQDYSYYPFGMEMENLSFTSASTLENNYLYNRKELQNDEFPDGSSLNWYDYGARMYDHQLGRWHRPDLLAENNINLSPYHYSLNNPVRFTDPDGHQPWDVTNKARTYLETWYEYGGKNPYMNYVMSPISYSDALSVGKIMYHSINLARMVSSYKSPYVVPPSLVYRFFDLNIPKGYSMGIDCSGLARLAFNADPDKKMADLPGGTTNDQMEAFKSAETEGTGLLHSDFSQLKEGDLVFELDESGIATHVMVATGKINVDRYGNVIKYEVIHAPKTGERVEPAVKKVKDNLRIGHTHRHTDDSSETLIQWFLGSFMDPFSTDWAGTDRY